MSNGGSDDDSGGGLDLGITGDAVKDQQQTAQQARQQQEDANDGDQATSQSSADEDSSTNSSETETSSAQGEEVGEADGNADTGSQETATQSSGSGQSDDSDGSLPPVKERENRFLAYLPESIGDKVDLAEAEIQLTWQKHGDGRDIGKLRHIYPIIMAEGAIAAQDLTADEIADYIDEIEQEDREL